mgnify:CR=1 FL=1
MITGICSGHFGSFQAAQDLQAVLPGKHDIQNRKRQFFFPDTVKRIFSIVTFQDFHPLIGKIDFHQIGNGLFVVHNQYFPFHNIPSPVFYTDKILAQK